MKIVMIFGIILIAVFGLSFTVFGLSFTVFGLSFTVFGLSFTVFGLSFTVFAEDSSIPDWVKNNAKWWSEGTISESDYITSLEYLIQNGIINLPTPISEVTAAQTMYSDDERAQSFRVTISNII